MTIAAYAYLHVTGWQMMLIYQLCLLQLLHRYDTDCLCLDLVLLVSADQILVAIRVHMHISCSGIDLDNFPLEL